jgi:protein-S-isoprenylcysteine O-methyltransferase Ste14
MTTTTSTPSKSAAVEFCGLFSRTLGLVYGPVVYAIFVATFVDAIGFLWRFIVPKTVNSRGTVPPFYAVVADLVLLGIFAIRHIGMAREGFKRVLAGYVSPVIERSTSVLCSSLALIALFYFWQPIRAMVWHIESLPTAFAVQCLSMIGWAIVLRGTFLIGHSELFGLKQVALNFVGRAAPAIGFRTPGLYRVIRHPIYLGLMIAVWATPTMTVGNFLLAAVTTAYVSIGIALEERDLVATLGEPYRQYKARVAMLLPGVL